MLDTVILDCPSLLLYSNQTDRIPPTGDSVPFKTKAASQPRAARAARGHARIRSQSTPAIGTPSAVRAAHTRHADVRTSASLDRIASKNEQPYRPHVDSQGSSGYHSSPDRSVHASNRNLGNMPVSGPMPADTLVQAQAVIIAVEALLAACLAHESAANTGDGAASPANNGPSPGDAREMGLLGWNLYAALADQTPDWHHLAGSEIAACTARLLDGIPEDLIRFDFIQMALAYAINHACIWNTPAVSVDDPGPLSNSVARPLHILDRIGRLRLPEHPERRKLHAAMDRALGGHATPRMREVGRRIIDVASEIANEALTRRFYRNEVENLLAACEQGNIESVHSAFECLYQLDRCFTSPYQTDADRHLALINKLSRQDQWRFTRTFVPPPWNPAQSPRTTEISAARVLHAYRDAVQSGMLPVAPVTAHLRHDLQRLMAGLFAAAAFLRREVPDVMPPNCPAAIGTPELLPGMPAPRTPELLLGMPAPRAPAWAATVQDVWRRIKPSPLEHAQRVLASTIKYQAARSGRLTPDQWRILDKAVSGVDRLREHPIKLSNSVQKYIGTLTPAECVTLDDVIDDYEFMKAGDAPNGSDIPGGRSAYIAALDTALTREPSIRFAAPAVKAAVYALRDGDGERALMLTLEDLASCLDTYASDPVAARMLCEAALTRLTLPAKHTRPVLSRLDTMESRRRIQNDINAGFVHRCVATPGLETARMMAMLQILAVALERHTS